MTESFAQKTVLVTGAAGFIGSHLAEELVRRNAKVRAFVRYKSDGSAGWLDRSPLRRDIDVVPGDITDHDSVRSAMKGCDTVLHLAALIAIPYSYVAPLSYQRVNVEGTLSVLQAAREAGVRRIVHTSTSETYGTARYVPIDENHPLQAQSPYAASKVGADKMAEAFFASFATPVVTVRPFNTYGPRQSERAVIPAVITQCLARREIKLGNLSPTRDFVFVADTVDGFCRAALTPGVEGLTINLGTGREVAIGDLARLIAELTGHSGGPITEERRVRPDKSEVQRLLANAELAQAKLGWKPATQLKEGLERTIEWMSANRDKSRPGDYVL